ncbi:MAG: ferritin-like domain-containing protein [Clostridia bacterium]|nr:ferritin-like domain-containing protein [Clostridia bacterium]
MTEPHKYAEYMPYPKVGNVDKNPQYVKLLMDDYAGKDSELTAITQYTFQHFTNGGGNVEVARTVLAIAKAEMKHYALLGEAIEKLGGDPECKGGHENMGNYWNGKNPNYGISPKEMLEANIQAEKTAIENYTKHAELIDEPDIKNLLLRIKRDEEIHLQLYTNLLNRINSKKD